jgi:hypothetical protein
MDMTARLEALASGPKPFATELRYSDGTVQRVAQPTRRQCENIAARYRPHVGLECMIRNDGLTKRFAILESVDVVPNA